MKLRERLARLNRWLRLVVNLVLLALISGPAALEERRLLRKLTLAAAASLVFVGTAAFIHEVGKSEPVPQAECRHRMRIVSRQLSQDVELAFTPETCTWSREAPGMEWCCESDADCRTTCVRTHVGAVGRCW